MISLRKMSKDYYWAFYKQYCIMELAKQSIENEIWTREEGISKAQNEQEECLKEGVETKDNYLFEIIKKDDDKTIGEIWFGIIEIEGIKKCFLFDLHILEEEQHKGYGKDSLKKVEDEVLKLGYKSIRLHVFKNNLTAMNLYKSIGYREFNSKGNSIWMEKNIEERK
jgi:ribosomal protein S18 acetylase RimI-like enzyme